MQKNKLLLIIFFLYFVSKISANGSEIVDSKYQDDGLNIGVLIPASSRFADWSYNYTKALMEEYIQYINVDRSPQSSSKLHDGFSMRSPQNSSEWIQKIIGYDIIDYNIVDDIQEWFSVNRFKYEIFFSVGSEAFRDMSVQAEIAGVVLVSGFQTASEVSSEGRFFSFQVGSPPEREYQSVIELLAINGAKNAMAVIEEIPGFTSFSLPCSDLTNILENLAMNLQHEIRYLSPFVTGLPSNQTEQYIKENAVDAILELDEPDILFFCTVPSRLEIFLEQFKKKNYNPKIVVASNDLTYQKEPTDDNPLLNYVIGVSQWADALRIPEGKHILHPTDLIEKIQNNYAIKVAGAEGRIGIGSMTIENVAHSLAGLSVIEEGILNSRDLTVDALQFSVARVSYQSFFGEIRFNINGVDLSHGMAAFQYLIDPPKSSDNHEDNDDNIDISKKNDLRAEGDDDLPHIDQVFVSPLRFALSSVIYPVPKFEEREQDLGWFQYDSEIIVFVISCVTIVYSMIWMIFIVINWNEDAIRYATPVFLLMILFGTIVMCCSNFTWMLYVTDSSCAATPWLLTLGYLLIIGSLLIKNYRVWRIWEAGKHLISYSFSFTLLVVYFGIILIPSLILLIVWSAIDPLEQKINVEDVLRPSEDYTTCHAGDTATGFIIALLCYCGIFLILNMILAIKTWKIDRAVLREGASIGISTYTFFFSIAIAVVVVVSDAVDYEANFVIRSVCLIIALLSVSSFLMIPKFRYVRKKKTIHDQSLTASVRSNSTNARTTSTAETLTQSGSGTSKTSKTDSL